MERGLYFSPFLRIHTEGPLPSTKVAKARITLLSEKLAKAALGILQGAWLCSCRAPGWISRSSAGRSKSLRPPLLPPPGVLGLIPSLSPQISFTLGSVPPAPCSPKPLVGAHSTYYIFNIFTLG